MGPDSSRFLEIPLNARRFTDISRLARLLARKFEVMQKYKEYARERARGTKNGLVRSEFARERAREHAREHTKYTLIRAK